MGLNEAYDDLGPGLHVLREADPLKRAGAIAAAMRADLCATVEQAEAAMEERSRLPPLDLTTLTTLQLLSRRVARAERIADRTRQRALVEVGERLAGTGAGLAVHPETVRERAAAVTAARAALEAAETAVSENEAAAAALEEELAADAARAGGASTDADHPGPAERQGRRARRSTPPRVRRSRALGLVVGSFGVALLLLGADALPLWAALLVPLAASLGALRYLRPREHDDRDDRAEASNLLAEVSASTDELFGARRAHLEVAERAMLLEADQNRAQEELRVAERAWHDLAGADVDVTAVEEVVHRFDPQHAETVALASETTGVRAAEAVVHQFRQRWGAFWGELGLAAPDVASGEAAVDELSARARRPVVLVGPAVGLGADLARAAPAAPVVVLEGPIGEDAETG